MVGRIAVIAWNRRNRRNRKHQGLLQHVGGLFADLFWIGLPVLAVDKLEFGKEAADMLK